VVVAEGDPFRDPDAGGFQSSEKLLRPGDPAEGNDWAVDRRNFHAPAQAPDEPAPSGPAEIGFEPRFIRWNSDDVRPLGRAQRLAQVSGRQEAVAPILPIEQQDIYIAVKLPVLEAVIQKVDGAVTGVGIDLGQKAGVVPLWSHIDGHSRRARN
jgi:hypothetical protein